LTTSSPSYVGIFEGHWDPSVAVIRDGKILAYSEEERHVRLKHAPRIYPLRALRYCFDQTGLKPGDIAAIGVNWNSPAFADGTMRAFFADMEQRWPLDANTRRWQEHVLDYYSMEKVRLRHELQWHRAFGNTTLPPIHPIPHHFTHALHSYLQSPFDSALCITIDGSGDQHCTVLWDCQGDSIRPIRVMCIPHSLGWFYAAFTEYLGFQAYDGEYKVMGLAAYGRPNAKLSDKIKKVISTAEDGLEYRLDPAYIYYGNHAWSERFTDSLVELLEHPMRLPQEPITDWHEDLAYVVQQELENAVCRLVEWGVNEVGVHNVCVGGGVGLNVKMNSRLFSLGCVHDLFAQPLCSDGGASVGAALGACWQLLGKRPERLKTLALGFGESDEAIERTLVVCGIPYEKANNIADVVAEELARGRIVAWFQGRMEAGPRALGQRSILADPRRPDIRDRVNGAVKFREYWRPFCPSIPAEDACKYFNTFTDAPFMNIAFEASEALVRDAPAIVHVDGTVRVQLVHQEVLPLFHALLKAFERRTGVPVLLNTSFNVKGEPIVCTISDALRTFFASGLEVLAAGSFVVRKRGTAGTM
jgi:carbamoyltransferase